MKSVNSWNLTNNKLHQLFKDNKEFISSIRKNNICGVQFHPEKSSEDGIMLIKNFLTKFKSAISQKIFMPIIFYKFFVISSVIFFASANNISVFSL